MADFRNIIEINNGLAPILQQSVIIALSSGRALMDGRIFVDGLDSNNSKIGTYKTKSYREYKERRGRQSAFVDLRLEGDLKNSLQVIPISSVETGIGFLNSFEALKANVNEERYGKDIFSFTNQELNSVLNVIVDELGRRIS